MAALTQNRSGPQMGDRSIADKFDLPIAASTLIYTGAMVAINSAGNAINVVAPVPAGGCVIVGRNSGSLKDNSAGSAGAIAVTATQGTFEWDNSGTDPITAADEGMPCYASDNHTVCRTDSGGTRPYAGKVCLVDSLGVWVETRLTEKGAGKQILTYMIDNASIAAGVILTFKPGFAGRITRVEYQVAKPVTTAAKLATLTPSIAGVNVTGGVLALTSVALTPTGTNVAGSAVTAANQFGAQDTIAITASAVTAFIEGTGTLTIYVE